MCSLKQFVFFHFSKTGVMKIFVVLSLCIAVASAVSLINYKFLCISFYLSEDDFLNKFLKTLT